MSCLDEGLTETVKEVLGWATMHLANGTWPRDDYRELVELLIVFLGGKVDGFVFKRPGPDHHARWLSKAIYFLKLHLLMNQFTMDKKEQQEVKVLGEFIGLFYAKAFLQCPVPSSAPVNDLSFMKNIHKWRLYQPRLSLLLDSSPVKGTCGI